MDHTSRTSNARVGFDTSRPVGSFIEVVRDVLVRPADFFNRLRASEEGVDFTSSGPTWRQIAFTMICLLASGFLILISASFDPLIGDTAVDIGSVVDTVRREPLFALTLAGIILIVWPLVALLTLYVSTFLHQIFVWIFIRRDNRSYWATFPVMAYVNATVFITWIPIIGVLLGLYAIYITTCGLRAMHDTTTTRALLAALPPHLLGLISAVIPYIQAL